MPQPVDVEQVGEQRLEPARLESDLVEALRFLLRVSPACVIPEIIFQRLGETI